jgi:CheY-like chemotaxis protein
VDEQGLILVVEDDEATRAFLLDNLAADGFRVAGASGVGEGLRAIEVRQPSLVVLDLVFEGGSGLDLLDRVRAADGLASRLDPDLPVVVLTGRAGEADRVRSFARGADDHLSKPTCRFPQREIPLLERAVALRGAPNPGVRHDRCMPSGPTPPLRGKVILAAGRHIYARVEHLSSGLIIRLGVPDARRPPLTNADNYLLTSGNRRLGTMRESAGVSPSSTIRRPGLAVGYRGTGPPERRSLRGRGDRVEDLAHTRR